MMVEIHSISKWLPVTEKDQNYLESSSYLNRHDFLLVNF